MANGNRIAILEQGRAKAAYDAAVRRNSEHLGKEYKQYAKKLPALIKTNGLGATFAFILSKDDKHYNALADDLISWLRISATTSNILSGVQNNQQFINKIISLDSTSYRLITNEALAYFTWLRRFAEGIFNN